MKGINCPQCNMNDKWIILPQGKHQCECGYVVATSMLEPESPPMRITNISMPFLDMVILYLIFFQF